MNAKAYFLVPSGRRFFYLRRDHRLPLQPGQEYHNYCSCECLLSTLEQGQEAVRPPDDSPSWPAVCECGYAFTDNDPRNTHEETIYRRADNNDEMLINDVPAGAIWNADWMNGMYDTEDGRILVARCPGGQDWSMDGRATNCDSPCKTCGKPYFLHIRTEDKKKNHPDWPNDANCTQYEDAKPHKCWIRHGEPPMLTVDKKGITCGAGAGSILTSNWHGFLTNGEFKQC